MSELGADFSLSFNSRRPMDHDSVGSAAIMRCDLFGPLERSVAGPGPADRIMRESIWASPVIDVVHHLRRIANNAVQRHHFVVGTFRSPFCAGTVIAHDVNEQSVVQHTHFLQGINEASYVLISVLSKAGERFHLPSLKLFLDQLSGNPMMEFPSGVSLAAR